MDLSILSSIPGLKCHRLNSERGKLLHVWYRIIKICLFVCFPFFNVAQAGYRHIDCACVYNNEKEVDAALKELFLTGVVKRDELLITSKLCNNAPEDDPKALTSSLEHLRLDYIDLYLMHGPFRTKPGTRGFDPEIILPTCLPETWTAMEGPYKSSNTRAIRVSNFSTKKRKNCIHLQKCSLLSIKWNATLSGSNLLFMTFASPLEFILCIFSVGISRPWLKCEILKEPILIEIAEKLDKSPAQVALRWGLQSGHSILPRV